MTDMERLKEAKKELEKIKKMVLELLHLNGVIAFDASKAVLDPDIEKRIQGEG